MENEIGNNTEYEKKISVADRKVLKCRTEYQRHEANRIQLKDEVCQLKGLVCVFITTNYTDKHKGFPLLRTCLLVLFVTSLLVVKLELRIHSSTLAWKIPWMEEPGGLQSMGSLGV